MANQKIAEINRKAWNTIAKQKKAVHPTKGKKEKKILEEFIGLLPQNGKVLDLGCGDGIPIGKKLAEAGLEITGIDVADEMVKAYAKNVSGSKTKRISMTDTNYNQEFDGIISSFSMLSLPPDDFKSTAMKIIQALKTEGWFLLILNEGDSKTGKVQEVQGQQMYSTGMSEDEIRRAFETGQMKIVKLERETVESEEYGTEHTMIFLMQKVN